MLKLLEQLFHLVVGVNRGSMSIGPLDADSVIALVVDVGGNDVHGNVAILQELLSGEFVDALGTSTSQSQYCEGTSNATNRI